MTGLSGSYAPEDVRFLLKPVEMSTVDLDEKERAIQSGTRHYSEMLAPEHAPSDDYMQAFHSAFALNRARLGRDIASLARRLAEHPGEEVVLVSLARAGTPVGVLLKRALAALGRRAHHYSISIIRDRGIDRVALDWITARHAAADVVFVDGWTGKGAIQGELAKELAALPHLRGAPLLVVSDLAGVADVAAGEDDYVIPSAILNGIISGLVSRTVLNDTVIGPGDFHGCVLLEHLRERDISRWYVDEQMTDVIAALPSTEAADWPPDRRAETAGRSRAFMAAIMGRLSLTNRHRVKPGIGEATRALLRRLPDRLFVRDRDGEDVRHLLRLAEARGVVVEVDGALPYRACAIIKSLGDV